MEMVSGTLGISGASGSVDSLIGLKFGKKTYFEDVGGGNSSKAAASASSALPPASSSVPLPAVPKKSKGVVQGGGQHQPPRCQVEGCKVDLTGAKAYYCRHKVCVMHTKSPKVIIAGMEKRFCQQCSRFHQLSEFDQWKRSCRRRLAGHNERRRKPPPGSLSSCFGLLFSSFYEEENRYGGFLVDFTHPRLTRLPGAARDMRPTATTCDCVGGHPWQGGLDAPSSSRVVEQGSHSYFQGSVGRTLFSNHEASSSECLGVSDSSCALSLLSNARNRGPTMSFNCNYEGTSLTGFESKSWGFKGHEACSSSNGTPHEMCLGQAQEYGNGQISGELELALQCNKQCAYHSHRPGYGSSGHQMHRSL